MRIRNFLAILAILGILLYAGSAQAGSYPYSESYVDGYFLAEGYTFRTEGIIYAYLPPSAFRDRLLAVCKTHGKLWAYGSDKKFACRNMVVPSTEEGGEGPDHFTLTIDGGGHHKAATTSRIPAVVFALKPFRPTTYTRRKLNAKEAGMLRFALMQDAAANAAALLELKRGNAWAVQDQAGKVPYLIVRSDPLAQDVETYSNEFKHLVMRHLPDGRWNRAEIDGTIVGFIDLDGDGIPAIRVSLDCDGTCQSLVSVKRNVQKLLDTSVH